MGKYRVCVRVALFIAILLFGYACKESGKNEDDGAVHADSLSALSQSTDSLGADSLIAKTDSLGKPIKYSTAVDSSKIVHNFSLSDSVHITRPYQRKDIKVKALYLTGWTVGLSARLNYFIDLANKTEINSYVVNIKDDDGFVAYKSNLTAVNNIKGWVNAYNVEKVLEAFHSNDIYIIGRLSCFKDPVLAEARPELAVKSKKGGVWRDPAGRAWLNPYNRDVWKFIVDIAKEAVNKGFDEIQFDYVRFANDGDYKDMDFSQYTEKKYEAIANFLKYAKEAMPNVKISADVFGIICVSSGDTEGIGQHLEHVGKDIEYLSPMVYPSHYALGQVINGTTFSKPDLEPYKVIYNTLMKAKSRIALVPQYKAQMRPYLQDFTAKWIGPGNYKSYGAMEVRQQIQAVYDAGYEEWIFWNAANRYSADAYLHPELYKVTPKVIAADSVNASKKTVVVTPKKILLLPILLPKKLP
ncbi:MAG: putative glycoside hydrolase [Bacteroidales bacterium]|nr:putative glycoside hydrolase [Bacteroidales bacterium]